MSFELLIEMFDLASSVLVNDFPATASSESSKPPLTEPCMKRATHLNKIFANSRAISQHGARQEPTSHEVDLQ